MRDLWLHSTLKELVTIEFSNISQFNMDSLLRTLNHVPVRDGGLM